MQFPAPGDGRPQKPQSRLDLVLDHIKRRIADGSLAPGDQLPPENELARMLGLSRTPVREAVKALAAVGVLVVRHGHGTFVADGAQASLGQLLLFELYLKSSTPQKLMEVRRIFERSCAELAAQRRTEEDLAEMRRCIERLRPLAGAQPPDLDATVEADLAFHRAIYKASGNELVATLANFVSTMIAGWLRRSHASGGLADTVRLHEVMYTMIETRNAAAARECYGADENMEYFRRILEQAQDEGEQGGARR